MRPKENFRVKVMSMAFFMVPDQPAVWRGPMVNSAFDRMAMGSDWGKLDVMIVDMPPGQLEASCFKSRTIVQVQHMQVLPNGAHPGSNLIPAICSSLLSSNAKNECSLNMV
eukprot:1160709-Pelagomonas_calceolata.AAC.5